MNIFQNELTKLFKNTKCLTDKKFVGNALLGRITNDTVAKAEFITTNVHDSYNAIRISVINRHEGEVDAMMLIFGNIFPKRGLRIWRCDGEFEWYKERPQPAEFELLRESLNNYLEMFADIKPAQEQNVGMTL